MLFFKRANCGTRIRDLLILYFKYGCIVAGFISISIDRNHTTDPVFAHICCKAAGNGEWHENDFTVCFHEFDTENGLFSLGGFFYVVFPEHQVSSDFASHNFFIQSYIRRKACERTEKRSKCVIGVNESLILIWTNYMIFQKMEISQVEQIFFTTY